MNRKIDFKDEVTVIHIERAISDLKKSELMIERGCHQTQTRRSEYYQGLTRE